MKNNYEENKEYKDYEKFISNKIALIPTMSVEVLMATWYANRKSIEDCRLSPRFWSLANALDVRIRDRMLEIKKETGIK